MTKTTFSLLQSPAFIKAVSPGLTGLFEDADNELISSLEFNNSISEDDLIFDYLNTTDSDLTVDELEDYLDSDIEFNLKF